MGTREKQDKNTDTTNSYDSNGRWEKGDRRKVKGPGLEEMRLGERKNKE